jgi:hypothetical protein
MPKTNRDFDYSIDHCIQRIKERYNLTMSKDDYNNLNKRVKNFIKTDQNKNDKSDFGFIINIEKYKDGKTYVMKIFNFLETEICLNFDTERDYITTILPNIKTI